MGERRTLARRSEQSQLASRSEQGQGTGPAVQSGQSICPGSGQTSGGHLGQQTEPTADGSEEELCGGVSGAQGVARDAGNCHHLRPKRCLEGKVRAGAAKESPELELWSQREGVGKECPHPSSCPPVPPATPCLLLAHPKEKAEGRGAPLL